jgi:TonB dependent receptor/CarboxypepD_reg-like domain
MLQSYLCKIVFCCIPLLGIMFPVAAQHKISGTVYNEKDKPVYGASVFLENTLDGATTDSMGVFKFTTTETGAQTIVVTEVSYDNAGMPINIDGDVTGIILRMHSKKSHELTEVVITAGAFEASNDKNKTTLKPLDIVTTAGANADVVKAMETLPGTQQTGTDNGLLVRGGDASEAAITVDRIVVQNAFISGPPGVSTRSRFGAFSYQGVSFSSGGYSARYGQALSGVLELTTTDMPEKSNLNLGANMGGLYASGTKKWTNSALDFGLAYTNLTPFYGLATTNFNFYKVPVGGSGNLRYVWAPNKNGIFKISLNTSYTESGITIPNPYAYDTVSGSVNPLGKLGNNINFVTKDQYYFSTASYKQTFKNKYTLFMAASYSYDQTDNMFATVPLGEKDNRTQLRTEIKDYVNARFSLLAGTEIQNFGVSKTYNTSSQQFTETQVAGYAEMEWIPINKIALRTGLRAEHSELLGKANLAPRISLAYKSGDNSQFSVASGMFYQNPDNEYLLVSSKLNMQRADHYIANWQWSKKEKLLRLEAYYKSYSDLVRELGSTYDPNRYRYIMNANLDNSGHGYAQGAELFWHDKHTVKNLDYWISYSYIDTRRLYRNFPFEATPSFIATHNLNLVGKYFVDKWSTNFSATYTFASGYPYFDPNKPLNSSTFLNDVTPAFNNIALTLSYLHTFGRWFTVFYVSIDNITDNHNIFGYRYSYDATGRAYDKSPIIPALYRTVFVGVNMSLTQFKKDEL